MTDDDEITEVQTQVVGIIEKLDEDDKIKIKKEEKEEDKEGEFEGQQIVTALALLDMENEVLQEMTSVPENCRTTYFFMQSFEAKLAQYFGITQRRLIDLYKRQVNFRPGDEMKVAKVVTEGMEKVEKEGMVYMVRKNMPNMVSSSECESEIVCDDCLEGENKEDKTLPKVDGDKSDGPTTTTNDKPVEESTTATKVDDEAKKTESPVDGHAADERDRQTNGDGLKNKTDGDDDIKLKSGVDSEETKNDEIEPKSAAGCENVDGEAGEKKEDGDGQVTEGNVDGGGEEKTGLEGDGLEAERKSAVGSENVDGEAGQKKEDGDGQVTVGKVDGGGEQETGVEGDGLEPEPKSAVGSENVDGEAGQKKEDGDGQVTEGKGDGGGEQKTGVEGDGLEPEQNVDGKAGQEKDGDGQVTEGKGDGGGEQKTGVEGDGLEPEQNVDGKAGQEKDGDGQVTEGKGDGGGEQKTGVEGDGLQKEVKSEEENGAVDGIEGATNLGEETGRKPAVKSDGLSAGEEDGKAKGSGVQLSTGIPIFSPRLVFSGYFRIKLFTMNLIR